MPLIDVTMWLCWKYTHTKKIKKNIFFPQAVLTRFRVHHLQSKYWQTRTLISNRLSLHCHFMHNSSTEICRAVGNLVLIALPRDTETYGRGGSWNQTINFVIVRQRFFPQPQSHSILLFISWDVKEVNDTWGTTLTNPQTHKTYLQCWQKLTRIPVMA